MLKISYSKICYVSLLGMLFTNAVFGQVEYGSFNYDGLDRSYIVYTPDSVQINSPLVLLLHGYDGTANEMINFTFMTEVADTAGFIVCFPQADQNRWNSGIGWPTSNTDDVGFISALMDTMHSNYGIDLQRIYVGGHSNGGIMAYKLVCEINNRIAKVAAVCSPQMPATISTCDSTQSMPMLLMFGTADPLVLYESGVPSIPGSFSAEETLDYWLGMNGCESSGDTVAMPNTDPFDGCNTEVITYGDCDESMPVVFYKMHGAGHHWPGVNHNLEWAGPPNLDFKADVELWNFFNTNNFEPQQPAVPEGFSGTVTDTSAILSWGANLESDLAGYNIYRGMVPVLYDSIRTIPLDTHYVDTDLIPGQVYFYRLTAINTTSLESPYTNLVYLTLSTTGTDANLAVPHRLLLNQNYPNPFNPTTAIQYELPKRSDVQITIYDLQGRVIATLVSETQDAGYKSVLWDASNVSSGMYFYQIRAGEFYKTNKMILLK